MRDLVLTMGCSIDLVVSGGPEEDIGGGGQEHPDFVERKLTWLSEAGVLGMGRGLYEESRTSGSPRTATTPGG